jgi:hypothetical protein
MAVLITLAGPGGSDHSESCPGGINTEGRVTSATDKCSSDSVEVRWSTFADSGIAGGRPDRLQDVARKARRRPAAEPTRACVELRATLEHAGSHFPLDSDATARDGSTAI